MPQNGHAEAKKSYLRAIYQRQAACISKAVTRVLISAICLSIAGLLYAQEREAVAHKTISLDEALALAERNPNLTAASAAIEGAAAGIVTASAYPNPSLSFGSLGRQQVLTPTAALPGMLHGLNFSQRFDLPNVRSSRIRAATVRRQGAQFALAETRLEIRGAVKHAFYEALRRTREVQLAQGNVDLLQDLRRRIQVQVDVGEAARLELTRAEAEVASARIAARSAQLRVAGALSQLSAAVGLPLGQVEPEGDLERSQILPPLSELQQEMLTKHPSLAVANSQIDFSEAMLASERAQRIPSPSFWADWFRQPEASQLRFGVSIDLPLWNKREGPIKEAQAARRQAAAVAQSRKVELLASLERAYSIYQVADQQVQIAEAGTLRQAEAAVEAAQAAFKFGERGIIEVLDAQRVLRAARFDYINAQFDRQQALIELEQLRAIDSGDKTK
jgi:cobalt-zinc-cadmium efflux system outer membrane protein